TGTCPCGSPRWPTCTATSAPGRCTGCSACAASRWTTPTSSCAPTRSKRRSSSCSTSSSSSSAGRSDCATGSILPPGPSRSWAATRCGRRRRGLTYRIDHGGGAFYGPKIDVKFNDAIGREWQGATIQLDFQLPERFQLEYAGEDNRPHRPVMIHRAIYGTLERFVGFLIEHFAGAFPLWLAPEQVRVLPIADAQGPAARAVRDQLAAAGLRVRLDERRDTLNYRIRDGETHKVPYLAVVGQREADAGT